MRRTRSPCCAARARCDRVSPPMPVSRCARSRNASSAAIGLPTSCATPAARRPTAARRCARSSPLRARRSSALTSRRSTTAFSSARVRRSSASLIALKASATSAASRGALDRQRARSKLALAERARGGGQSLERRHHAPAQQRGAERGEDDDVEREQRRDRASAAARSRSDASAGSRATTTSPPGTGVAKRIASQGAPGSHQRGAAARARRRRAARSRVDRVRGWRRSTPPRPFAPIRHQRVPGTSARPARGARAPRRPARGRAGRAARASLWHEQQDASTTVAASITSPRLVTTSASRPPRAVDAARRRGPATREGRGSSSRPSFSSR